MHPPAQLLRHLLQIAFDTRSAHAKQQSRLAARLDDTLCPGAANLIVGVEHVGDLRAVGGSGCVGEEVLEGEGVFERLACALSLPWRGRVGGIAEQCHAAFGVRGCQGVVKDCPSG